MKALYRHLIIALGTFATTTAMADVTLFEGENFSGRQFRMDQPVTDLRGTGLNHRAQSAIVEGYAWQVCSDANFGGACTALAPGRYPTLGPWSDRISSARPSGAPVATLPAPAGPLPGYGAITFYGARDFGGRLFALNQPLPNFEGTGANDRAASVVVEGGPWEVCVDADYRGECRVLAPGSYASLDNFTHRISSARPAYDGPPRDRMRSRASATLYSGPNLSGTAFTLGGEGSTNLYGLFNDRAASLRVEQGYWIFCSDADFRGECLTFGPGEYASLPPELNHRISSGRRISNNYPYANNPNWR